MSFISARSISNEGLLFLTQSDESTTNSVSSLPCRSISRGFSRSSVCGADELSITRVAPEALFAGDILDQVEETLSKANSEIRTISRKNSRCLDSAVESQEWDAWGLQSKSEAANIGLNSRANSMASLSRSNSILDSRPSSILGKRSLSAGLMFLCDHPYDNQDGLHLEAVPEFDADTSCSSRTSSPASTDDAMQSESSESSDDSVMECVLGDADFAFSRDEDAMPHCTKRRRVTCSSPSTSDEEGEPCAEQQDGERAALTLKLLHAVARTEAGRTLLALACNSNKKSRFAFSADIEASIPVELREQVLARVTYDPSVKGTANRSEFTLPARDNMPPMIESLCAAGLLDGIADCTTEVVADADGACALRLACVLDGERVSWDRRACSSCGSCFSRFMYEGGKYAEFRRITHDITAGHRSWSAVAGHTLCEPCYRHFTKYGHLNNPRRVSLQALSHILEAAAQSSAVPGPQAKTRSGRRVRTHPSPTAKGRGL